MFRLSLVLACIILPLSAQAAAVYTHAKGDWWSVQPTQDQNASWTFNTTGSVSSDFGSSELTAQPWVSASAISPQRNIAAIGDPLPPATRYVLAVFIRDWLSSLDFRKHPWQAFAVMSSISSFVNNNFGSGTPTVPDPSPVPLPAAGWLFISAILGLFGRKALRRQTP